MQHEIGLIRGVEHADAVAMDEKRGPKLPTPPAKLDPLKIALPVTIRCNFRRVGRNSNTMASEYFSKANNLS